MSRAASPPDRDLGLWVCLAAAYGGFALTFRGPPEAFWRRMTVQGAALGSLALALEPGTRKLRPGRGDLRRGALSAAALYGAFLAGDAVARRVMPRGEDNIESVYSLRSQGGSWAIAARLALVIAPAEELFWRGLVQRRLGRRLGGRRAALAATLLYGGAHLVTGNPTLFAAATVAGAWWSSLAARGASMESLVTSHALWDVLILLVAPTSRPGASLS